MNLYEFNKNRGRQVFNSRFDNDEGTMVYRKYGCGIEDAAKIAYLCRLSDEDLSRMFYLSGKILQERKATFKKMKGNK